MILSKLQLTLDNIFDDSKQLIQTIIETSEELDIDCFIVGGFIRDMLLNRHSKDIDFVVLGDGIQFAKKVATKLNVKCSVFKNFGTAMIKYSEVEIEFVGARKESYTLNSRKPSVQPGTLQDDQNRRDFTINALAISLNKENFGELIDPFEGQNSIEKKLIKTPIDPDQTFSDDPLRMMRAIRFATQLDFHIDPITFTSIKKQAHRITIVSQERITTELNKIMQSPKPSIGFKLMFEAGLLDYFFSEVVKLYGKETIDGKSHKDNFFHTLQVLDNLAEVSNNLWLRWAALLHDIGKPVTKRYSKQNGWTFHGHEDFGSRMVPKIFRKLKLPLSQPMHFVKKMVALHMRPIILASEIVTDSAVRRLLFDAGEDIENLLLLCKADITTKNEFKKNKYKNNYELVEQKLKEVEEKDKITNWQPPISGIEIMELLKLKPSKVVGNIKNEIKEAILTGKIPNKKEKAIEYMYEIINKKELNPTHPINQ